MNKVWIYTLVIAALGLIFVIGVFYKNNVATSPSSGIEIDRCMVGRLVYVDSGTISYDGYQISGRIYTIVGLPGRYIVSAEEVDTELDFFICLWFGLDLSLPTFEGMEETLFIDGVVIHEYPPK